MITGKRKFYLTLGVLVGSFILAVLGNLDGGAWVTVATLALGVHAAANVVDKKVGGQG